MGGFRSNVTTRLGLLFVAGCLFCSGLVYGRDPDLRVERVLGQRCLGSLI